MIPEEIADPETLPLDRNNNEGDFIEIKHQGPRKEKPSCYNVWGHIKKLDIFFSVYANYEEIRDPKFVMNLILDNLNAKKEAKKEEKRLKKLLEETEDIEEKVEIYQKISEVMDIYFD